jgi:hypothetical protein
MGDSTRRHSVKGITKEPASNFLFDNNGTQVCSLQFNLTSSSVHAQKTGLRYPRKGQGEAVVQSFVNYAYIIHSNRIFNSLVYT